LLAANTYELCMNYDVNGHVLRLSYNLPVLYLYCDSFFMRDVHGEFALINVHLLDILPAISSKKNQGFFSVWRVVTLHNCICCITAVIVGRRQRFGWTKPLRRHKPHAAVAAALCVTDIASVQLRPQPKPALSHTAIRGLVCCLMVSTLVVSLAQWLRRRSLAGGLSLIYT